MSNLKLWIKYTDLPLQIHYFVNHKGEVGFVVYQVNEEGNNLKNIYSRWFSDKL